MQAQVGNCKCSYIAKKVISFYFSQNFPGTNHLFAILTVHVVNYTLIKGLDYKVAPYDCDCDFNHVLQNRKK